MAAKDVALRKRIAGRIKARRVELNLTIKVVAKAARVTSDAMSRYENALNSIPADILPRVSDAITMPVVEILYGKAA